MAVWNPKANDIFLEAVEVDDLDGRRRLLDRACGGDADLRIQVESLLQAGDRAGSFLEAPAPGRSPGATAIRRDLPLPEGPGSVIGPYKLLEQLGEGGMGAVFLAEQSHPVRRQIALKVIKAGMDTRQVVARFEAERQALALMDHPNIARVLDAGATDTGRPYFAMELVKGVPITRYCDEHRLTPEHRLGLFLQVCHAVQHAHTKGVIHRDLKPSNVMVGSYDGRPVPKVIDFGVAKATGARLTDHTLFTGLGTVVGTPEYMSPEQAELNQLDVDTRSDVYSLGVILYELLTGSTPLERDRLKKAALMELLRVVREEEPPRPSTRLSTSERLPSIAASRGLDPGKLSGVVRGELDWIVMRCLEKDRSRRYETANGLARDVERYLADEAVQACPPSAAYRFGKAARRNKAALATAGLVLLICLTLTGGIGWNLRDRAARQTAVDREVNLALDEAEQLQGQAKWPEALSAARRAEGLLAAGGGSEISRRVQQLRRNLEMVLRLEEIPLLVSEWKVDRFDYEAADKAYEKVFADYGIGVASLPVEEAAARLRAPTGFAVALVPALDDWAYSRSRSDPAGATRLRAVAQAADPDPWRRQVREAVERKDTKALTTLAASPEMLRQPPTTLLVLSRALRARGNVEVEIDVLREAQRQYPGDFWINFELAHSLDRRKSDTSSEEAISFHRAAVALRPQNSAAHTNLGSALRGQMKLPEAIAVCEKAVELNPQNARACSALGNALFENGELDRAVIHLRKAIELEPKSSYAHSALGSVLVAQRNLPEAVAMLRRAIELDPKSAYAYAGLGRALMDQEKWPEAVAAHQKSIELDPTDAMTYNNYSGTLRRQKKLPEALAALHKAIELDPKHTLAYANLGEVLKEQGKLDEAIAAYRKAIEFNPKDAKFRVAFGDALSDGGMRGDAIAAYGEAIELDPRHAHAYCRLGAALIDQGKLPEGEAAFRTAIEVDAKHTCAYSNLGLTLQKQGKLDEAVAWSRKAVEVDPKGADAHNTLGLALHDQGKVDDAAACYRQAIALDPKHADAHSNLGIALSDQQKPDEAIALYRKALEIDPKHVAAHVSLGNRSYQQGKLDEAIAWYRKALELDPKDTYAQYGVGIVLKAQGNVEEAITWFRKVIETDPKHANAQSTLAKSLMIVSQKAKDPAGCRAAAEMWEKLHRTDPGSLYDAACLRAVTAEVIGQDPTTPADDAARLAGEEADRAMAWLEQAVAAGYSDVEHMKTRDADLHVLRERADFQKLVVESERKRTAARESALEENARRLSREPDDDRLLASRAALLVQLGRRGEAEAAYRAAVRLNTSDPSLHRALADVLLALGRSVDAASEYAEALRLRPGEHASCYGLGTAYARLGRWDDAAAAFRQAAELSPAGLPTLVRTAALSFYTGDVATYRRACRGLLDHYRKTDNFQIADNVAKTCSLAPGFGGDPQQVIDLAEVAVVGPKSDTWFEVTKALVYYRAGRFRPAADVITRSGPSNEIHRDALAFSILAMARHHQGKADEAGVALSKAQGVISAKMPKVESGETFGDDWHDWLHARILCGEAEKLLGKEPDEGGASGLGSGVGVRQTESPPGPRLLTDDSG